MSQLAGVLLGLAGGLAGWFAANFYGRSLVLFFELRGLAYEEMMFSADLTSTLDPVQFNASAERLRRIAARLKSLDEMAPVVVRGLWSWTGYQPGTAADSIVGYAYSVDPPQRHAFRARVEEALRFRLWSGRAQAVQLVTET
jgi:hypothetical protein